MGKDDLGRSSPARPAFEEARAGPILVANKDVK